MVIKTILRRYVTTRSAGKKWQYIFLCPQTPMAVPRRRSFVNRIRLLRPMQSDPTHDFYSAYRILFPFWWTPLNSLSLFHQFCTAIFQSYVTANAPQGSAKGPLLSQTLLRRSVAGLIKLTINLSTLKSQPSRPRDLKSAPNRNKFAKKLCADSLDLESRFLATFARRKGSVWGGEKSWRGCGVAEGRVWKITVW